MAVHDSARPSVIQTDRPSLRWRFALAGDFHLLKDSSHSTVTMQWILFQFQGDQTSIEAQGLLINGTQLIASKKQNKITARHFALLCIDAIFVVVVWAILRNLPNGELSLALLLPSALALSTMQILLLVKVARLYFNNGKGGLP